MDSNAEWLEDLHDIVYGFLMTDAADIYSGEMAEFTEDSVNSQPQRPIRPRARLRSLQLVLEVYESVRDFDDHRGLLCDRV